MNYREKIREAISCPQFGDDHYGEWGALRLDQRKLIKRLLDELDRADEFTKLLLKEQDKENNKEIEINRYKTIILQNEEKDVKIMNSENFIERSKEIVRDYVNSHLDKSDTYIIEDIDVYIVWYNYTLGNSKALISTSLLDGMYYEVTYNKNKDEIYLDAYKKFENKVYKDE